MRKGHGIRHLGSGVIGVVGGLLTNDAVRAAIVTNPWGAVGLAVLGGLGGLGYFGGRRIK